MAANATENVVFTAPDISCGHCVARVQTAVSAVPGVAAVTADADTKQVKVSFDPASTTSVMISAALAEAGYPAPAQ